MVSHRNLISHVVCQNMIAFLCLLELKTESKLSGESIKLDTSRWLCPYHVLKAPTMISCIDVCVSYTDCESVNYNTKTLLCELFVKTDKEYDLREGATNRLFIDMAIINQIERTNPCYVRPCGKGERCIPDRGHFICETPDVCPSLYLVAGPCGVPSSHIVATSGVILDGFRLDSNNDWCAEHQQANESIQVEFRSDRIVKEVITQGSGKGRLVESWVEAYTLGYSIDCVNYRYVMNSNRQIMVFGGNTDRRTHVSHILPYRITARCVKLGAIRWTNNICLRFDLIGCISNE